MTAFFHGYFAHRAFQVSRPVQFVLGVAGCTAGQRGPLWWAAHHRLHHQHALFALFLDESLTYSAAIFDSPAASLEAAQTAKLDRICRKLGLCASDRVIEIGSGWGSFAIHAARRYGCRVTTTTVSPAQLGLARERIARAGLADRVEVLLTDYRDLTGRYDKLVSIEMIEAVGHEFLPMYFKCRRAAPRARRPGTDPGHQGGFRRALPGGRAAAAAPAAVPYNAGGLKAEGLDRQPSGTA